MKLYLNVAFQIKVKSLQHKNILILQKDVQKTFHLVLHWYPISLLLCVKLPHLSSSAAIEFLKTLLPTYKVHFISERATFY